MKRRAALFIGAVLVFALACVTINVYFPEAAIKDLSKQIEEEIARQAAEKAVRESGQAEQPPQPKPDPPPPARLPSASLLDELFGVAYAQSVPAPEVTSPAIRKIIESRAARVAEIDRHKASGVLGENSRALLEIRNLEALADLKSRAEVQKLVRQENADREELFKEMAVAKGVDPAQIDRIRETYAGTLRENARKGEWIQLPDGTWKQK